jgi:peptidyl-prolyl cis-trans isomerase B (cyclophilin B)
VADHACFFLLKEYDDAPVAAPTPEETPANDESSFSMQPVLIFLVLVAVIGFYIIRRRGQQQQRDEKEFDA